MFSDFKFLLNRSVRRSGANTYIENKQVLDNSSSCLSDVFDQGGDERYQVLSFSDGILEVACLEESDADGLEKNGEELIDKINKKLDSPKVRQINILT